MTTTARVDSTHVSNLHPSKGSYSYFLLFHFPPTIHMFVIVFAKHPRHTFKHYFVRISANVRLLFDILFRQYPYVVHNRIHFPPTTSRSCVILFYFSTNNQQVVRYFIFPPATSRSCVILFYFSTNNQQVVVI